MYYHLLIFIQNIYDILKKYRLNKKKFFTYNTYNNHNITFKYHNIISQILLQFLLKYIVDFDFTDELWNSMIVKMKKDYSNEFLNPEQVARFEYFNYTYLFCVIIHVFCVCLSVLFV